MILEFHHVATFEGDNIEMVPELSDLISVYDIRGDNTVHRRVASDNLDIPLALVDNNLVFTAQEILSYGIRSFPYLGPYAFWREKYSDNTHIVIPLYNEDVGRLPTVVFESVAGGIKYTITPPQDSKYYCYKLHFRQGHFSREYVTYELEGAVELATGGYFSSCRGYSRDGYNSAMTASQLIVV